MTAADITALVTALGTPVAAGAAFVMRWSSQAGRAIRDMRIELDAWVAYAYRVRRIAASSGVDDLPEPPKDRDPGD